MINECLVTKFFLTQMLTLQHLGILSFAITKYNDLVIVVQSSAKSHKLLVSRILHTYNWKIM